MKITGAQSAVDTEWEKLAQKVGTTTGTRDAMQGTKPYRETGCENNSSTRRSRHACVIEDHESTRTRNDQIEARDHEDHIAEKGFTSLTHYNLVHKPIPVHRAMIIPDATAAVDKEWEKLEHFPAWQVTKVKN